VEVSGQSTHCVVRRPLKPQLNCNEPKPFQVLLPPAEMSARLDAAVAAAGPGALFDAYAHAMAKIESKSC
jgi:hypothetical protein